MISRRAQLLKPSPTLAMAAKAKELQSQGHDVVSLTVGEPDWPTYDVVGAAAIQAIQSGFTKYTVAHGIPELRRAVAKKTQEQIGIVYSESDVVIGAGAKYIIYSALMMLVDAGDEVLIPAPYWVSYPTMVELAGGISHIIPTQSSHQFKMTASDLEQAITAKSKVLILCSPSNPTGFQYTSRELQALAEVLLKHPKLIVISDDIYNQLVFGKDSIAPHLLQICPQLKERVVIVNGASKSYSMTGWRVGWGLGPRELMVPMADFLSQTTSNVCSISQKAALKAIETCDQEVQKSVQTLLKRRDWFATQLATDPRYEFHKPDGAFYFWVGIKNFLERKNLKSGKVLKSSKDVAEVLLTDYFLATVPGIEFGCEGYLRLSYATSDANLEKAWSRLRSFSTDTQ